MSNVPLVVIIIALLVILAVTVVIPFVAFLMSVWEGEIDPYYDQQSVKHGEKRGRARDVANRRARDVANRRAGSAEGHVGRVVNWKNPNLDDKKSAKKS